MGTQPEPDQKKMSKGPQTEELDEPAVSKAM